MQVFWGSPKFWQRFSEIAFAFRSYPQGALRLTMQTATPACGLRGTGCIFLGGSRKCWKRFSEIAFMFRSYPQGVLRLMIHTATLAYGLRWSSCNFFHGQPQILETLLQNRLCVVFVSARRPKAHDANACACLCGRADSFLGGQHFRNPSAKSPAPALLVALGALNVTKAADSTPARRI